ncbi:MAG: FkbM family methyltransferase [Planctomycetota bacterium]
MGLRTKIGWQLWKSKVRAAGGVCTSRGIKMQTGHPSVTDRVAYALYRQNYEAHEFRVLGSQLRPDDVVLDLGCGMGFISLACATRLTGGGRVIGVEANPSLIPLIRENFALNGQTIELIHGAISDQPGTVDIDFADDFRYSGVGLDGGDRRETVPTVVLNDLLTTHRPTGLVSDIEGVETRVLNASIDLSSLRFLSVEVHANLTGDAAISTMMSALFDHGFVLDIRSTSMPVLFFTRPDTGPDTHLKPEQP